MNKPNVIKETATCGGWKVVRYDDNKIEVYKDGELCPKSAPELRKIADALGMEYKDEWRTSQLGRNVMKAMLDGQGKPASASAGAEGTMTLIEKLRYTFIVEDEDQVYYDAETADYVLDGYKDLFIDNIHAQNEPKENEILDKLMYTGADDFIAYLENDPDELNLAYKIICAAYATFGGYDIANDDPRIVRDWTLYYFNDCEDLHYEIESDIDLG